MIEQVQPVSLNPIGYEAHRDIYDMLYTCTGRSNFCHSHYHKQMELLYVVEGEQVVKINGNTYVLNEGDIAIINSYDLHEYSRCGAITFVCCIPYKAISNFLNYTNNNKFKEAILKNSKESEVIHQLMLSLANESNSNELIVSSNVLRLLGTLVEFVPLLNTQNNVEYNLVNQVVKYIDEHYSELISLQDIATNCNYSKFYISKIFNKAYNCNINDFINIKRLEAFIKLHFEEEGNISENALAVGFNSTRAFYNAFKKQFNSTPKEFFMARKTINK